MDDETKSTLDHVIDRFYETAIEMRSKILAESPGILHEQYKTAIYLLLVPFQNDLLERFARRLNKADLMYFYRGLDQVVFKVLAMPTLADITDAHPAPTPGSKPGGARPSRPRASSSPKHRRRK